MWRHKVLTFFPAELEVEGVKTLESWGREVEQGRSRCSAERRRSWFFFVIHVECTFSFSWYHVVVDRLLKLRWLTFHVEFMQHIAKLVLPH